MATVIVLGGNFGGNAVVHLLTQEAKKLKHKLNIVWVSPSKYQFFNLAVPRALVQPEQVDKILFDIEQVAQSLANDWAPITYLQGRAVASDLKAKSVTIEKVAAAAGSEPVVTLSYDFLVVASGARNGSPLLKLSDVPYEPKSLKDIAQEIKSAKTVAVLGGGPSGVEVSGEIKYKYPNKKVVLFTGSTGPLVKMYNGSRSKIAQKKLEKAGVEVVNNLRSKSVSPGAQYTITFADGSVQTFDFAIDCTGVTPNTEYLAKTGVLDSNGSVKTNQELRVVGFEDSVVAIGDVVVGATRMVADLLYSQKGVMAATLSRVVFKKSTKAKSYKPLKSFGGLVAINRTTGVGVLFGVPVPDFVTSFFKGKGYMISDAKSMLT